MKVPWLPKKVIAGAAEGVIAEYQIKAGQAVSPPIPVENIIEQGLKLNLGFADLRAKMEMDDVLGATYVEKRLICIDESLVKENPDGRYFFTCAHEVAHWVLHSKLLHHQTAGLQKGGASIFCRVKDAKHPIEWQADYFASCLLIPEEVVKLAFRQIYGDRPLVLYNVKGAFCGPICFDPCIENWPRIAGLVKEASGFSNVSKQAMIIRLQELGLVKNETRAPMAWGETHALA